MEKHIQLVGILNLVYRALILLASFILFAVAFFFRYLVEILSHYEYRGPNEVPPEILAIIPIVLTCIGALMFIGSVAGMIASVGVLKKKEWGRIVLLTVSFLNLLHVPLGTMLGVYTIWVLFNDDIIRMFNPQMVPPAKPQ
jgi:hypothetical protein